MRSLRLARLCIQTSKYQGSLSRVPYPSLIRSRASSSSSWTSIDPVDLSYDVVSPPSGSTSDQSLVLCHGLLGSKQNWRSLAKTFAQRLGMPVYTLDLRNHGSSPHVEPHSYPAMALDISHFLAKHDLTNVNLLGHSMGGKAVMAFALNSQLNKPLRSLISVDMTPAIGKMSPEFPAYVEGMLEVEHAKVKSKGDADKILEKYEKDLGTRQFLLTNARTASSGHLAFRVPLHLLSRAIVNIGDFPYTPPPPVSPTSPIWEGPTLFLKGEHSKYINRKNLPTAEAFFPNMKLEVLPTGHWVHAEKPLETVKVVEDFIKGVKA